jgi:hypothetical protein
MIKDKSNSFTRRVLIDKCRQTYRINVISQDGRLPAVIPGELQKQPRNGLEYACFAKLKQAICRVY